MTVACPQAGEGATFLGTHELFQMNIGSLLSLLLQDLPLKGRSNQYQNHDLTGPDVCNLPNAFSGYALNIDQGPFPN